MKKAIPLKIKQLKNEKVIKALKVTFTARKSM